MSADTLKIDWHLTATALEIRNRELVAKNDTLERSLAQARCPEGWLNATGEPVRLYAAKFSLMNVTLFYDDRIPEGTIEMRDLRGKLLGKIINVETAASTAPKSGEG